MTDAIIQSHQGVLDIDVLNYAQFLKTPLELGMFVPVDEDGNILEEPNPNNRKYSPENNGMFRFVEEAYNYDVKRYNKAKERVIFEGFELCNRNSSLLCVVNEDTHIHNFDKTIEDLVPHNLTLTQNAIKTYKI